MKKKKEGLPNASQYLKKHLVISHVQHLVERIAHERTLDHVFISIHTETTRRGRHLCGEISHSNA